MTHRHMCRPTVPAQGRSIDHTIGTHVAPDRRFGMWGAARVTYRDARTPQRDRSSDEAN